MKYLLQKMFQNLKCFQRHATIAIVPMVADGFLTPDDIPDLPGPSFGLASPDLPVSLGPGGWVSLCPELAFAPQARLPGVRQAYFVFPPKAYLPCDLSGPDCCKDTCFSAQRERGPFSKAFPARMTLGMKRCPVSTPPGTHQPPPRYWTAAIMLKRWALSVKSEA